MARHLLTHEDKEFIELLAAHIRSSMEYSIFNHDPLASDIVLLRAALPDYLCNRPSGEYVSLGDLTKCCEASGSNKMIYEAWIQSVLNCAYMVAKCLDDVDKERFIRYVKSWCGVDDEDALAKQANEAIEEAYQALYG